MKNIQVVILAAGKGKRMNMEMPKALVPFRGHPMIDNVITAVFHSGIENKPLVVVGYQKEQVMEYLGDKALYAVQDQQLGTGHAVQITKDSIPKEIEHVLVLFADQPAITGAMISNLALTHLENNKSLTMATVKVPSFSDWYQVFYAPFSRIIRRSDGSIERSVEFRDATETEKEITELNPCYFCFKKDWLFEHLAMLKNENAQGEFYLTDVVKYAGENSQIASVDISPEEALGVNSIEELERLEKIITIKN